MSSFENPSPDASITDRKEFSNESFPPSILSMYLWDSCKKGSLFKRETYNEPMFLSFANQFLERVFQDVIVPPQFNKNSVFEKLRSKMLAALKQSSSLSSLESADPHNVKSVEHLAEESRREGEEQFRKIEEFLKQDVFPPTLWVELSRMGETYVDCMIFMIRRLEKWAAFTPRRTSQIRERSERVRWMMKPFADLANRFYETFLRFEQVYLFMELASCEDESELFTEKLWSFREKDYAKFEPILFGFHDSITALQQTLLELQPKEITVDFSKPAGWVFKQLVQSVAT